MLLLGAAEKRGAISLPPRLHGRCENPRGRTVICRFGRVACPRSSVALSTLALFKLILDESSYDCSGSLRWSGGKPGVPSGGSPAAVEAALPNLRIGPT